MERGDEEAVRAVRGLRKVADRRANGGLTKG
jgi:hypothetical protein